MSQIALMSACRNDSGPYAETFVNYDIVQLAEQSEETGAKFLLYRPEGNEPVIYTEKRAVIDTNRVKIGNRLLLGYISENELYVSGEISATGYSPIFNSKLKYLATDSIQKLKNNQTGVFLYSIWRAGPFLNLHGKTTYTDEKALMVMCADSLDLASPNPVLSVDIIYYMDDPKENFQRDFYASFDLSEFWENPESQGLTVTLDNTNLKINTFSFSK